MTTYTEEDRAEAIQTILRKREYARQYYLEHKEKWTADYQEHKEERAVHDRRYRQEHKVEKAAYERQHRRDNRDNREKAAERERRYHKAHQEELAARARQYHQEHLEEHAERDHQYHLDHKEEHTTYSRQYNEDHKERLKECHRQYSQEHPEVHRLAGARRRALIAGSDGNFTTEEFSLLCEAFENRCAYCDEELPLGPDHVIPLSRGGSNNIINILPACSPCNSKKGTMTYDEFMERIGVTTP